MRSITPVTSPIHQTFRLPGDKSISHRAIIFTALTKGESHITNLGTGEDVESTISVLQQLGLKINFSKDKAVATVFSGGLQGLHEPEEALDAGNSGTTIRLMTGLLSGRQFSSVVSGDASLRKRPMQRIVHPLRLMNAKIQGTEYGTAPLIITPSDLHGIDYQMPIASAQVKSAIILAALQADSPTQIHEQLISRRHTEIMLQAFGAPIQINGQDIEVRPTAIPLKPYRLTVPGDPSSAAFWATATAIIPDSQCQIKDVNLSPERIAFYRILSRMGAHVEITIQDDSIEPRGDILVENRQLHGLTVEKSLIPALIDELPLIAVLGAFAEGETVVRNAGELRHKECDRITAIVQNLKEMNVSVNEVKDGFYIKGGKQPASAQFDSFNDHRIAMAFSIAGVAGSGESSMINPEAASVSYPEFWDVLNDISEAAS